MNDSQIIDVTYRLNHQQATSQLAAVAAAQARLASTVRTSFESVGDGAKALASRMAPAAAAISGVGSALGSSGGQMGKFVGAAAQGAAAFGAGGPWGLAIVGATLAIDEYTRVTRESQAALGVWRQQLATVTPFMERSRDIVKSTADEAKRLSMEAANAGKTQHEVAIAVAEQQQIEIRAKLANIEATSRLRQAAVNKAEQELESAKLHRRGVEDAKIELEQALALQAAFGAQGTVAKEYRSQIEVLGNSVIDLANAWTVVESRAKAAARAATPKTVDPGIVIDKASGDRDAMLQGARDRAEREAELETSSQLWLTKMREEAVAHRLENDKVAAEKQTELKKKTTEAMLDVERSYWNQVRDVGASAMGSLLSATQGYIEAKIKGEKDAELKAVASFLSSTGQMLVASGTRGILEGAIISSNPLTPGAGAGMIATGAGAVAVGLAMGAGGAALAHTTAGGKVGHALPAEPRIKDINAPPSRNGAGGGAGITIIYQGASGATSEETYRAVDRANRKIAKRGMRRP